VGRFSKKKAAMKKYHEVHEVRFEGDKLLVHVDGQRLERDLDEVSSLLLNAPEDLRNHYHVSPSGYGIHWPLLDEDISIDGLLGIEHSPEFASAVAESQSNYTR
jgi:hypothetical protein